MLRHILIWFFLAIYLMFSKSVVGNTLSNIIYVVLIIFNFSLSYYLLLLIVFPFFFNRITYLVLACLLTLTLYVSFDYINLQQILPLINALARRSKLGFTDFFYTSLLLWSFVFFSALGSFFSRRAIIRFKELKEKEKDIISLELNFLKSQFNSHLTFNFFNFCYAKVFKISAVVANSIEHFSEMLHYSLKVKPNQHISLYEEVNYIENFIAIQKCITNNAYINLSVEGNTQGFNIVPMLLSVFVENATKHGVLNDAKHPIKIIIQVVNNVLKFTVANVKKNQKIITNTGIGLNNVKQILNLFYENNHSLIINETSNDYSIELKLNTSL